MLEILLLVGDGEKFYNIIRRMEMMGDFAMNINKKKGLSI